MGFEGLLVQLGRRHHAVLERVTVEIGVWAAIPDDDVALAFAVRPGVDLVLAGRQAIETDVLVLRDERMPIGLRRRGRQIGVWHKNGREALAFLVNTVDRDPAVGIIAINRGARIGLPVDAVVSWIEPRLRDFLTGFRRGFIRRK